MGEEDFECTPWGNPTYNIFGWQKPCYLIQDGYAATFQELMESTEWSHYGKPERNHKCAHCMVHSGYEPTAVDRTFNTWKGFARTVMTTLTGSFGKSRSMPEARPTLSQRPSPTFVPVDTLVAKKAS